MVHDDALNDAQRAVEHFRQLDGRRPRILIGNIGQGGSKHRQKVLATGFADLGFDIDIAPLLGTPQALVFHAVDNDAHMIVISFQADDQAELAQALLAALSEQERNDILVVWDGVELPHSRELLPAASADTLLLPSTRVIEVALPLIESLSRALVEHPSVSPHNQLMARPELSNDALAYGVLARQRSLLSCAITRTESRLRVHQQQSQEVLMQLLPRTGKAIRLGISGALGVGKSHFVETLGLRLIECGHRVAVLALDQRNQASHGSILRDKACMEKLSLRDEAFVRPIAVAEYADGITRSTRDSLHLCEAAGFDVILIEAPGSSERATEIADLVDCCLLVMEPVVGEHSANVVNDWLELADIVAVNKADGKLSDDAERTVIACQRMLSKHRTRSSWQPSVHACSALSGDGLDEVWQKVRYHRRQMIDTGEFVARREQQRVKWK